MPPMSFLSELMSSSSSSSGGAGTAAGARLTAAEIASMGRSAFDENQYSDTASEPEKESAKLVSIRELVARNAAKARPANEHANGGDRQQTLSEMLGRKMGGNASSDSATASPSSSASTTPTAFSPRHASAPSSGKSARQTLNEMMLKRQPSNSPASKQPVPEVSSVSPKPTARRKRAENPALQALLSSRSGASTATSSSSVTAAKSSANAETRSRAVADLLAKRVAPHPAPQTTESSGDERKNALAEMLTKRGSGSSASKEKKPQNNNAVADMLARRQPSSAPSAPVQKVPSDPKANALADMLAKRNGGGAPAAATPPKKSNALADMLAKRTAPPPPTGGDTRGNALAEMLAKRGGGNSAEPAKPEKASTNPLAAMLAKRQTPPPATPAAAAPANPLAAMLAKRQADAAAPAPAPAPAAPQDKPSGEPEDEHASTPLRDHPKYASYFKMLKIGMGPDVVKHRMRKEGVDPAILDSDPSKPLPKAPAGGAALDGQDPEFLAALKMYNAKLPKYQQMLKMGLPRGAVEQKMRMEGIDVAWLDGPPQPKKTVAPAGPTEAEIAAHREKYKQYFTMLKMGLPRGAVEQKMRMAAVDPRELDGPIVAGAAPQGGRSGLPPVASVKKANAIRKKLHWEVKRQETRDSRRESLWNLTLDEDSSLAQVKISKESKEMLEQLFVKEVTSKASGAAAGGAGGKKAGANAKEPKKLVMYLIDMKKSQNIAITLARIKLPFPELKAEILALNPTVLSTAQLQSLMDMWPDQQEQVAIDNFHGDESLIGAAEKFLVEVRNIPRFREKLGCLVFKQEFPTRVHELRESINLVIRGVNQVCCSSALQQLFIYILQTGNLLNFGTEDVDSGNVGGFSLGSLVKLSQTKAFTGGMTFLQYVVQSIQRDIPQLCRFPQQINLIQKCSKVSISSLFAEKRALEEGLKSLKHEAQAVVPAEADADAELGASILKHFAAEVERELDALQGMLDQLMDCKTKFLEYFEEEETSEELDLLLTYIANFSTEFQREHTKHLEVLEKKRLQEQQRLDQEAKKQKLKLSKAPRHSLHENPLENQHRSNQHGHGHGHASRHRHTLYARPEELDLPKEKPKDKDKDQPQPQPPPPPPPQQQAEAETPKAAGSGRSQNYFPQFVVDHLKKKPSFGEKAGSLSRQNSGLAASGTSAA